MAKETPAERRDRMYNEAVAAKRARLAAEAGGQAAPMPMAAPQPMAQQPMMRSPTIDLVNARARQLWMQDVESGATQLDFPQWLQTHQHELPR